MAKTVVWGGGGCVAVGDMMLEVDVIWLRRLLGLEGGFVAIRGCGPGR